MYIKVYSRLFLQKCAKEAHIGEVRSDMSGFPPNLKAKGGATHRLLQVIRSTNQVQLKLHHVTVGHAPYYSFLTNRYILLTCVLQFLVKWAGEITELLQNKSIISNLK